MPKVLVIEREEPIRAIYRAKFQAEGYDVVEADNGEDALTATLREKPDIIITCILLPKVSGFDVIDILKHTDETKHIPIIVSTNLSQEADKARAKRLGAELYLVKTETTVSKLVDAANTTLNFRRESEMQIPEPFLSSLIKWFTGSNQSVRASVPEQTITVKDEKWLLGNVEASRGLYTSLQSVNTLRPGKAHLHGIFKQVTSRFARSGLRITEAIFTDETGSVRVVWFKANVAPLIKRDTVYDLQGTFKLSNQRFEIQNAKFRDLREGCLEGAEKADMAPQVVAKPEVTFKNTWTEYIYGKGLNHDSKWQSLRNSVFRRDGYKCVLCGANQNLTVDHIKELSIGGRNELANLRALCKDCHEEKHLQRFLERGFDADDNYGEDYKLSKKIRALDEALRAKGSLSIKYKDKFEVRSYRIVHPKDIWRDPRNKRLYIRAYCELDKADRTFRISRLELSTSKRNEYLDEPRYEANAPWASFRAHG